jgi:hypothetical protein
MKRRTQTPTGVPHELPNQKQLNGNGTENIHFRSRAQVGRFSAGLELVPPYEGAPAEVTYVGVWRAEDPGLADTDDSRWLCCGVARRP